ncbi:MAG: ferrous iron transport protein B [Desulfurococcaceae archaeon]
MRRLRVALAGQPNVGKSTLFNVLTKGHVLVVNWPGTTVELHEGRLIHNNCEIILVDLPGIYGLSYLTLEERIARRYIVEERPDVIVVLVDSLALDRTLHLAIEIMELSSNIIIAITKIDITHSKGIHVNYELMARKLGVPVIPLSAIKGIGIERLLHEIARFRIIRGEPLVIDYGVLNNTIEKMISMLKPVEHLFKYPLRWIVVKFLEGDVEIESLLRNTVMDLYVDLTGLRENASRLVNEDLAAYIYKRRSAFIENLLRDVVVKTKLALTRESGLSKLFYKQYIGPLFSFIFLILVFSVAFFINTGYPLTALLESLGRDDLAELIHRYTLGGIVEKSLETLSEYLYSQFSETPLTRLVVEGVLGGVSALLLFIPLIAIVLLFLGIIEDSGLLPRIAVGIHGLTQWIGLSGHALLPVTVSLGCNVPGALSIRAIPNSLERFRLLMLIPFIPCQARLVVLLALSTFGGIAGVLLTPIAYITAFMVFIVLNYLLYRLSTKRGEETGVELLLEIPPLHRPHPRVLWWFTWSNLKHFIMKIGLLLVVFNVLTWLLANTTPQLNLANDVDESIAAHISRIFTPLLSPLGIQGANAWIVVFALIMGFFAKEIFISTLLVVTKSYGVKEALMVLNITPASLVALGVFTVLYVPCVTTVLTIYNETRSLKTVLASIAIMLIVAYSSSIIAYHVSALVMPVK